MTNRKYFIATILCFSALLLTYCSADGQTNMTTPTDSIQNQERLLVFSKTEGWRHQSIEAGQQAIKTLGKDNSVGVTVTENASMFNPDTLQQYSAVIFLNTTGTVFNDAQRSAFETYIRNGGGYVGVHSAADTEYDWPWYGNLMGAYFENHPPGTPNADVLLEDSNHPSTSMLPDVWNRDDEWYNYQGFSDHINVLLSLDTDSYEGSDHAGNHPIAWYHEFDGGRAFYTGMGHTEASYSNELYLEHLWGGILYAMSE
jgi:type 1 glutamine amidotransferase